MTHIISLEKEKFEETAESFLALVLRSKRKISIGDTIIFECDGLQQEREVHSISEKPGLMKGFALYIFEPITNHPF